MHRRSPSSQSRPGRPAYDGRLAPRPVLAGTRSSGEVGRRLTARLRFGPPPRRSERLGAHVGASTQLHCARAGGSSANWSASGLAPNAVSWRITESKPRSGGLGRAGVTSKPLLRRLLVLALMRSPSSAVAAVVVAMLTQRVLVARVRTPRSRMRLTSERTARSQSTSPARRPNSRGPILAEAIRAPPRRCLGTRER